MTNYRHIWKQHYGEIPKDKNGKPFDIHHIDGNKSNNCVENLKAVSLQEHYDIHFEKGEYGACWLILKRLYMTNEEFSVLASAIQRRKVENGTHIFLDKELARERCLKQVRNGTHNFQGNSNPSHKKLKEGTHPFQRQNFHKEHVTKLIEEGKFHSFKEHTCPHCGKVGKANTMFRWHFNNCKQIKETHEFKR